MSSNILQNYKKVYFSKLQKSIFFKITKKDLTFEKVFFTNKTHILYIKNMAKGTVHLTNCMLSKVKHIDADNNLGIAVNTNILIELGFELINMANGGNETAQEIVKSKFEVINKK